MTSAEWICTRCGTVNRALLKPGPEPRDTCVVCHTRHRIEPEERPVRWKATALK